MSASAYAQQVGRSGTRPPVPKILNGQFVLTVPFAPYGPRPDQPNNIFFFDTLDTMWERSKGLAEHLVKPWTSRNATHGTAGPIFAPGYHDQYPFTNWIGRGSQYADFLEWLVARVPVITLFVLPDCPPYYFPSGSNYHASTFDWGLIERDLTPVYSHPRIQALTKTGNLRVCSQWEQFSSTAIMADVFDYLRRVFPDAIRFWHNPAGHGSPCLSNENEQESWVSALAHGIDGMLLQGDFVESNELPHHTIEEIVRMPTESRNLIEQMMYGCWDMLRRFNGNNGSPWGSQPMLTTRGVPATVEAAEGTAYPCYWHSLNPEIVGPNWNRACRDVPGITNVLDGF